jgi:hypothetical protein
MKDFVTTLKILIISFGIALLLPLLFYKSFQMVYPSVQYPAAEPTEENIAHWKYEHKRNYTYLFYSALITGIVAIILGAFIPLEFLVGSGFILGGIFIVSSGMVFTWYELSNRIQLFALLIVFILLLGVAYFLIEKRKTS